MEKINSSMNKGTETISKTNMYEEMASWGTGQLKDYLMISGISYAGTRQEILSRAFVAWEQKSDIRMSEKELKSKLQQEYEGRLKKFSLEDPRAIGKENWQDDCTKWPRLDLGKIFSFLVENRDQEVEFVGKYKTHKAYSYFGSGFVDTIYVLKQGNVSILKSKVTPSMSVRNCPHEVWVAIEHDTSIIKCCWCTCTAGFAQTCNHVISTLYKIEYAATLGYIDPCCTSMPCGWNKGTKRTVQPVGLMDMNISQDNRLNAEKTKSIYTEKRKQFDQQHVSSANLSALFGKISMVKPGAVIFKSLPSSPGNTSIPLSVFDLARNHISCGGEKHSFTETLSMTRKQVEEVEKQTREQNNNPIWHEQKKGRLTSSMHHDIHTKMMTIAKTKVQEILKFQIW